MRISSVRSFGLHWRCALFAIALAVTPLQVLAQLTHDQQRVRMFQDVMQGRRSLQSLSPADQRAYLQIASLMAPRCPASGEKCKAICNAAEELESAAKELADCARKRDLSDECWSQFADVRDAHDDYEAAVSNGDGQCD